MEANYLDGLIGLHPKGRNLRISHLSFADDVMIFYDVKPRSLEEIINTLEEFSAFSSLSMSKEKSALFTAGLNPAETFESSSFGFLTGSLPIRYL